MKKYLIAAMLFAGCTPMQSKIDVEYNKTLLSMAQHCKDSGGDSVKPVGWENWIGIPAFKKPIVFNCTRWEKLTGITHRKTLHIYRLKWTGETFTVEVR